LRPAFDPGRHREETWSATHLYYFATPYVFAGRRGQFSAGLFRTFCDYYVTGFLGAVRAVQSVAPELRAVFHPSSVAVEELPPNMAEYAAAKSAGEVAGRFLETMSPGLTVHVPRLPRLATDQTASFLPVANLDPAPLLLQHLRDLRERAGPHRPAHGR